VSNPPSTLGGRTRIVFAAGGTAGHVEPALATADKVRELHPNADIVFLATKTGIENQLVPARGYELLTVPKAVLPRRISKDLALLPLRLIRAVVVTKRALSGADVVVGFGGYLAGTAYLAAWISRIPIVVHEANVKAGLANKLGSLLTNKVALVDARARLRGGVVIGLPMRKSIIFWAEKANGDLSACQTEARSALHLELDKPTLLVIGGSQGSMQINAAVAQALDELIANGIQILHAVGGRNELPEAKSGYFPTSYLDKIEIAYAAADLLIARSGAATCQEAIAFGLPAVLVPLSHGNGEQALNADALVEAGAAMIIRDDLFNGDVLFIRSNEILRDDNLRKRMRSASKGLARVGAATELAQIVTNAVSGLN